ncbi:MAG: hypothetical protein QOD61_2373 [Solirubrobacteraceae bacterium]|nr:hypothetical protein [Solirubrobacteraceae bacterium]
MSPSAPPTAAAPSLFHRLYVLVAGRHPNLRPWHFQWLAGTPLYAVLRPLLGPVEGSVLDVGCGYKPYRAWVPGATRYFGIDVVPGPEVDAVIEPGEPWPVADGEFDVVVCTQVLEHVGDLELTVDELVRAVRPGGEALITVPFIFGEHNSPHDYRRFSRHGVRRLLEDRFEIIGVYPHGGIGSTLGSILLGWTYDAMPGSAGGRAAIVLLLPAWLGFCLVVNLLGWIGDRIDRTGLYYGNVLIHVRRAGAA